MRIGEFARAARTTPRTVRHYHQLGLLPEPARRSNGYREYELSDLIALLRITWLAGAGVPLPVVGEIVAKQGGSDVSRDLDVVMQVMTTERDRIDRRIAALGRIRAAYEEGRGLTALPAELADALDRLICAATGRTRDLLHRDREMLEGIALAGELPAELVSAYVQIASDPQQLHDALRAATALGAIEGRPVGEVEAQIAQAVDLLERSPVMREILVDATGEVELSEDNLAFYVPDAAQREVVVRLFRRLR